MSMPNTFTIDKEANVLIQLATDMDRYRRYYSMKEEHTNESIFVKFVAPKLIAFEEYRFYLLKNSETKPLSPVNYYRPDYVSYTEYGTINLWALLLFINDIPTIEDFDVENILVPTQKSILEISRNVLARNLVTELVPLTDLAPSATSPLFSRVKSLPFIHDEPATPVLPPVNTYFMKETFTVDVVTARQRYVDLLYAPSPGSVLLQVPGGPNYTYGKHYTIIKGNKGLNRLTWDPKLIPNGSGMISILIEGTEFQVSYYRILAQNESTPTALLQTTILKTIEGNPDYTVNAMQYQATSTPSSTWDESDNANVGRKFTVGSLVVDVNTQILYRCADATPNNAKWFIIGQNQNE